MRVRTDALPFDLGSLEIFLAVSEHGAMAEAARRLGLTQPAISLAIAELERKTRTQLFDRGVRPIALTPAGMMLQQRASALLLDARQIPALLQDAERGKPPQVRCGLVDSLAHALTAPLTNFLGERANEVAMLSGLTEAHAGALLTRRLDVFLGVDEMADLEGLERYPLCDEPYVLALPAGQAAPASVDDLTALARRLPLIRFSARSKTGKDIDRHLRRLEIDVPHRFEFDSPFGLTALVECGDGFAITTPLCLIEARPSWRRVTIAPLPGPSLRRGMTLVARRHELGTIPRDAAKLARAEIERCLSEAASRFAGVDLKGRTGDGA